ncbi:MAG TPA: radical SAM protein [Polyangia bacterium]|nr:radical SAM protein [Polyangia bacterium]
MGSVAQSLGTNLLVKLGEVTHRTHVLPLVLLGVTARCNSRCVSCDFWRSDGATDLTRDEIARLAAELAGLGTRVVVFTGGEPLFRPDVLELADLFRARGITLHLLTSGIALERFARDVAQRFADVTVSLDGHSAEQYRQIRGVDGLPALARGIAALRAQAPGLPLSARSTLHRHNFREMGAIIETARAIGVPRLSFLAADVEPSSFNRDAGRLPRAQPSPGQALLLDAGEVGEFAGVVETVIRDHAAALAAGTVTPGPAGLRRLVQYYGAHLGLNPFPPVACNAPWMSVFIAADGAVRPCFFHPPVGNLRTRSLRELVTVAMPDFRRRLDVATDATCQRCVCNVKTGLRTRLW